MNVDRYRLQKLLPRALVVGAGGGVLALSTGVALAEIIRTPNGEVEIGTTAADNPHGRYLSVANGGNADTWESNSAAVSTTGDARGGLVSVSGTGCGHHGWAVDFGGRCADGAFLLAVSPQGDARRSAISQSSPPVAAVSGTGCADSFVVGVSGTGCSTGVIAVSGTGYATATTPLVNGAVPAVAVSGLGAATSPQVAVGANGAQGGTLAVAALGNATGGPVAAAGFGDATGSVVAATLTGRASGGMVNVSVFGDTG